MSQESEIIRNVRKIGKGCVYMESFLFNFLSMNLTIHGFIWLCCFFNSSFPYSLSSVSLLYNFYISELLLYECWIILYAYRNKGFSKALPLSDFYFLCHLCIVFFFFLKETLYVWNEPKWCIKGISLPEKKLSTCETVDFWLKVGAGVGAFTAVLLVALTCYFWKKNKK